MTIYVSDNICAMFMRRLLGERAKSKANSTVDIQIGVAIECVLQEVNLGEKPPHFVNIGRPPEVVLPEYFMRKVGETAVNARLFHLKLAYDHGLSEIANLALGSSAEGNLNIAFAESQNDI